MLTGRNPNGAQSTPQMVHWPAYDVDKQQYLRIGKYAYDAQTGSRDGNQLVVFGACVYWRFRTLFE